MAGMQNGPVSSNLILLSNLHQTLPGEKIRFLGCITNYSTKTAILTLEHNHPRSSSLKALVDVKLLLGTLKSDETQIGQWVNVIGYVVSPVRTKMKEAISESNVTVQAIVLWPSGPLKLDSYERCLDQQLS